MSARDSHGRFGRRARVRVDRFSGVSHVPTSSWVETADKRWRRAVDPISGKLVGQWRRAS